MKRRNDSAAFESFPDSRWSLLGDLASGDARRKHLPELARIYWRPLYTFMRRKGQNHQDAKDLTQECFVRLIEGDSLAGFKGASRFRIFLRGVALHVLKDWHRERYALKRGRGAISLDALERLPEIEIKGSADEAYDREWARVVEERATTLLLERLTAPRDQRKRRVVELYLLPRLRLEPNAPKQAEAARLVGCKPDDIENDLRAIRALAEPLLRRVVHDTVASTDEIEPELRKLEGKA